MNNTKISSIILAAAFTMSFSTTVIAAGDAAAGAEKAAVCLTCHGQGDQVTGANTPIIAGQYEDYLIYALQSYRSGERANAIMGGFASALSDQDIEDLAAFYASMESSLFTPIE